MEEGVRKRGADFLVGKLASTPDNKASALNITESLGQMAGCLEGVMDIPAWPGKCELPREDDETAVFEGDFLAQTLELQPFYQAQQRLTFSSGENLQGLLSVEARRKSSSIERWG